MPGYENENIYRACRMRANKASGNEAFRSREKVELACAGRGKSISAASIKDYEAGNTIPSANTVNILAEVYGTPELKWMHCAKQCPIGKDIARSDDEIGTDDLYSTYFEFAGSFDRVDEIERRLHSIIADKELSEHEVPILCEILRVMERIAENAKDLRIWMAKEGYTIDDGEEVARS